MSDVLIDQDTMGDIGDAIREKLGVSDTYLPASMPDAIRSISGGGGGGSAKYIEKELWSGTLKTVNATASLSESIYNFDQIKILWTPYNGTDNIYHSFTTIPVSDVIINQIAQFLIAVDYANAQYTAYISCCFSDSYTLKINEVGNGTYTDIRILKIIGIKWETMQTALVYSEEEREVGVWTDGKPLYQKTLCYNEHLYGDVNKDVTDLNIDTCVDISGMTGENSQYGYCTTFGYARQSSSANITALYNGQSKKLQLRFGSDYSSSNYFNGCNITLFYTKITDQAGSGIWTTTGEYAYHYSTDEHVIGTWIDGKPLYERVIIDSRSGGFSTGEYEIYSDASTYHLIPNGLQGMLYNSAGSHYPVPWIGNNNSTSLHKNTSGKIVLTVRNDNYNNYILEVIVRYTKTTS